MTPNEEVFSKNRYNLLLLNLTSLTLSFTTTFFKLLILLLFNSKKYKDASFIELTTYLLLPILVISEIPIEGTKDFNGSINPNTLCELFNGYFSTFN